MRRIASLHIHFRRSERSVRVGARSKPEFGCVVRGRPPKTRDQFVIAGRGQPAPEPGFAFKANVTENTRELRRVIRII